MENKIHLEGFIKNDTDDGISLQNEKKGWGGTQLIDLIAAQISNDEFDKLPVSTQGELDEDMGGITYLIRDCKLSMYFSGDKMSLEDVQEKHIFQTLGGDLDALGQNYGYSEWTIVGMTQELTVGGHDLQEELKSHDGEYVHIVIEY